MKSSIQSLESLPSSRGHCIQPQVQSQLESFAAGVSDICSREIEGIVSAQQAYYQIKTLLEDLKINSGFEELT